VIKNEWRETLISELVPGERVVAEGMAGDYVVVTETRILWGSTTSRERIGVINIPDIAKVADGIVDTHRYVLRSPFVYAWLHHDIERSRERGCVPSRPALKGPGLCWTAERLSYL